MEIRWYQTPRLWVDLLQRATGKLRWSPMNNSHISIYRFDVFELGYGEGISGAKALLDSLKVRTYGRPDGRALNYFGAILDDGPDNIARYDFHEIAVSDPALAKCRVTVNLGRPTGPSTSIP